MREKGSGMRRLEEADFLFNFVFVCDRVGPVAADGRVEQIKIGGGGG